jgi:polar amino acid transport system substrate-binding protein
MIPKLLSQIRSYVARLSLPIALLSFLWLTAPAAIAQPMAETPPEAIVEPVAAPIAESPQPTLLKSDIEQIKAKGKLVIAMVNKNNPPFFSESKDGKLFGTDVEIGQSIADSLGVKAEFVRKAKNFDDVIDTVYRGEADLAISKLARSMPRAQKVLFSKPYLAFRQALLVNRLALAREKSHGLSTDQVVQNFRGKIGVYAGSVYVQYARETFPKAEIVEFANWQDAIDAVVADKVMALFRDELEVRSIVVTHPELAIQLRTVVLTDTSDTKGIVASSEKQFLMEYTDLFLETQYKQRNTNQLLDSSIVK